ncbi:TauD/TfdA dioxygenase family protein [Yinghuangia soli]|uniref:TauD/TfdA family dioxygenase n=1 Tax=Yinghuangia soli TaxID=2908204 RepID=A0AA41PW83_9ACTN|nr:TauD/TfdA family dioxygenase [Yinghuangia soli]MCF2526044.1 TauD/TfdA family dioxygenase [Yinghuangia soli]
MSLSIRQLPQALGAVVTGLPEKFDSVLGEQLHEAWMEHLVLFFPQAHLDDERLVELGSLFGDLAATTPGEENDARDYMTKLGKGGEILELDSDKERGANIWHTDLTFAETPSIGALLSMQVCPERGGDTMWLNQYRAYETLAEPVRILADSLRAKHGRAPFTGTAVHPVVTTHPVTGRRTLFVNRGWTAGIEGLSSIESNAILRMLCEHAERPENTVRWTWQAGDAALWDNRCTQHYAINDYGDAKRVLHRVAIYPRAAA